MEILFIRQKLSKKKKKTNQKGSMCDSATNRYFKKRSLHGNFICLLKFLGVCSKEWVTLTAPGYPVNPLQKNLWLPSMSTFFKALTEIPPIYISDIWVQIYLKNHEFTLCWQQSWGSHLGWVQPWIQGVVWKSKCQAGKQRENLRSRIIIRINQLNAELLITS